MSKLLASPSKNAIQKTLAAQLLSTASTGDPITFDDVDGIPNLPGVLVIRRVDSSGTATPSFREYIEYSGTSGTTVLITTRNVDSSNSALTHPVGSIVEFIPDVTWADRIYDALSNVVDPATLAVDTTKIAVPTALKADDNGIDIEQIATPTNPASGRNKLYFKSDELPYTLTSAGTETALTVGTLPVKASGAEITTGTDDDKFVTAKALADAAVGKIGAAWATWTPTFTNFTKGSATVDAKYVQIGKTVHARLKVVLAADSSVSGSIVFSLPVTTISEAGVDGIATIGSATFFDANVGGYSGVASASSTTNCVIRIMNASATYVTFTATSSTVPFTWTTTDEFAANLTYEAA